MSQKMVILPTVFGLGCTYGRGKYWEYVFLLHLLCCTVSLLCLFCCLISWDTGAATLLVSEVASWSTLHLPKLILSSAGLTSGSVVHFASGGSGGAGTKNQQQQPRPQPASAASAASALDRDKDLTGNLELGELGQLTITNDNESSFDVCDAFGLFRDDYNPAFFVLSAN